MTHTFFEEWEEKVPSEQLGDSAVGEIGKATLHRILFVQGVTK